MLIWSDTFVATVVQCMFKSKKQNMFNKRQCFYLTEVHKLNNIAVRFFHISNAIKLQLNLITLTTLLVLYGLSQYVKINNLMIRMVG